MSSKDKANLMAILDAIGKIISYTREISTAREYYRNGVVFDATLMNFVVIGEMVDRLSDDAKRKSTRLDWQKVTDFRNLVAHDYLGVDAEEVWQIIQNDIPTLKTDVEEILQNLDE